MRITSVENVGRMSTYTDSFDFHMRSFSSSSELKIKLDPSLDRSLCEFFKVIKNHGPKNQPPGCNLGPKFPPHVGKSVKRN